MRTEALQQIGLTQGEIKVYLALLRLGQTTAGPIVDEAGVTRSKIYDILERLKQKGLVGYIVKEATRYFSAAPPSNILSYLDEREQAIHQEKEEIKRIIPDLVMQYSRARHKNMAEIFVGIRGMQNAYQEIIASFEEKEPYYAFGAGKGEDTKKIQRFWSELHRERVKKRVKSYIIFNELARGLFRSQEKSRFVEARYLMPSTITAVNIYKEYTVIGIFAKEPINFLMRSKEVADSFREYFRTLWKLARK